MLLLTIVCLLGVAATPPQHGLSPDRFLRHVVHLASEELQGRGNGTPELERAAEYVAAEFASYGLQPFGDGRTFFQPFPVTEMALLGPSNALRIDGSDQQPGKDFETLPVSASGVYEGGLVFAGYGITAPSLAWDDYAAVDVRGKSVVVLSHHPWEHMPWIRLSNAMVSIEMKVRTAKLHGARAVFVVLDPNNHPAEDELAAIAPAYLIPHDMGVLAAYVSRQAFEPLFAKMGRTLSSVQHEIDRSLRPASFALTGAHVRLVADVGRRTAVARNVVAALPAARGNGEWLVIGAHYDHLGRGHGHYPLPGDAGKTHHGADDNASGTAGLLELARLLVRERETLERSILFVAFAGEEVGLMGSHSFVDASPVPLTSVSAMLNLDMIGRLSPRSPLNVMGARVPEQLAEWIRRENERARLNLSFSSGVSGSSDWAVFQAMGIPAVTFFTGLHEDYHRPSDTADKINVPASMKILTLIAGTARQIATAATSTRHLPIRSVLPTVRPGLAGLGTDPIFSPSLNALHFQTVPAGTAAARAGVRTEDVVVEMAEARVRTPLEFEAVLQTFRPGDMATLVVRRGRRIVHLTVTLDARSAAAGAGSRRGSAD